jgi:uncharacterized protein (DUF885 family)
MTQRVHGEALPMNTSRTLVRAALVAVVTPALFSPAFAQEKMTAERIAAESAKANAYFDRVFDEDVDRSPMTQAYLGIQKDNDKWDDYSELRQTEDLARTAQRLAELKRDINFAALDEQTKISYRLFVHEGERELEAWRWRYHRYVFTQMGGMHSQAPAFLINFQWRARLMPAPTSRDCARCRRRSTS